MEGEFHTTTKKQRGGLRVKEQRLCSAARGYLLELEGEPVIVPGRECKEREREEMRGYFCVCLKTRLCLIHPTQAAHRSRQLLCKLPSPSNLLALPKPLQRARLVNARGERITAWEHRDSNFFLQILFRLIYL